MTPVTPRPLHFPALALVLDPDAGDREDPCALVLGVRNLLFLAGVAVTLVLLRWVV